MSYKILADDRITDLEEAVNTAIVEGWRPLGGVAVAVAVGATTFGDSVEDWQYLQVMVRDDD